MLSLSKSTDIRLYRCYKKKNRTINMSALVSNTLMHFCERHRKYIVKIIITSRVSVNNILINSS